MINRETKESGFDKIEVSIDDKHYLKIGTTVDSESLKGRTCIWLREGDPHTGSKAVSMFVIEPLKNDLFLMAFGGAGDAVFDSFGTFRECLERAIANV